jgi:hypothetical protein
VIGETVSLPAAGGYAVAASPGKSCGGASRSVVTVNDDDRRKAWEFPPLPDSEAVVRRLHDGGSDATANFRRFSRLTKTSGSY